MSSWGGTRYNFWMKLTPQKLEGWRYRKVKISCRVTERRTDGWTGDSTQRTKHAIVR